MAVGHFLTLAYLAGHSILGKVLKNKNPAQMGNAFEAAKSLKEYSASMGLGEGMTATEAFTTYTAERKDILDKFTDVKAPDGTLLADKLAADPNIKGSFDTALALTVETQQKQKRFAEEIKLLNDFILDPNSNYTPQSVVTYFHEIKDDAVKAIKDQHEAEKNALAEQFKEGKLGALKAALGIAPNDTVKIEKVKKDMTEALQKSQTEELSKFEKSVNDSINKMHKEAQKERDRVAFFAKLYENDTMKKIIDDWYNQNRMPGSQISLNFEEVSKSAKFKGLTAQALNSLTTFTGLPMRANDDGSFSMDLPSRLFSPIYYSDLSKKLDEDMLSIVGAVRASGFDYIELSFQGDEEHALTLARAAYSAARAWGYPEANITFKINGKDTIMRRDSSEKESAQKIKDELFRETPELKTAADNRAKLYDPEREKITKSLDTVQDQKDLRKRVQEFKNRPRVELDVPPENPNQTPSV